MSEHSSEQTSVAEKDFSENPCFRSMVKAAEGFAVLKWMFEQRQDILATFIHQIAVPAEAMQPRLTRIRATRK